MNNNPFEEHGVKYLSPTAFNKFAKDPAKWLVNIAGYKDRFFSAPMSFGIVIETGITHGCMTDASINECIDAAMEEYVRLHKEIKELDAPYNWEACNKKQKQVAETLTQVIPQYRALGHPIAAQEWVEFSLPDFPIPIRGKVDMLYEDCVRDIKTTGYAVKPKADYDRQLTFYAYATDRAPKLDYVYVTTKKVELISQDVKNVNKHFNDIKRITDKMMRMLSLSSDINEVAYLSCLEPNITNEDFYNQWGANEIVGAKKMFNL